MFTIKNTTMDKLRSIEQIIQPPPAHMVGDGFRVHNFFPGNGLMSLQRMSPFFLLDYGAKVEYPPTDTPRGVGVHPHRGFETVTISYHGRVAHHDSTGKSGVIGEGDVQWMTAASGVLHKEYHEKEWSQKGGLMQMVQLWVNLPAKHKMDAPGYQPIRRGDYGLVSLPDNQGTVEVIAGSYKGVSGPAHSFTPVEMYNARLNKGADVLFSFPQHYNTAFLVIEGSVLVNDDPVPTDFFVLFANDGQEIRLETPDESAVVLILSGEPINEPIVPYGPFVMNTKQEIIQAYEDFNNGKFGQLED